MTKPKDPEKWEEFYRKERDRSNRYRSDPTNKIKIKSYKKQYYKDHPHKYYESSIKKKFDLSLEQYEAMWLLQDGRCYLCRKKNRKEARLAVDHCHDTGQIRGLLCHSCNTALGLLEDDVVRILAMVDYLKKDRAK